MGNTIGRSKRKTTKIMKINGETTKLKTPIQAMEIINQHPGNVLLDSESVKHFGIRAKPLDPVQFLEPKRLYFLVELPKVNEDHHKAPRRVRSGGMHVSAKDRLESLMLSRRSASDLSAIRKTGTGVAEDGPTTVRMRLPRVEVERLMKQSKDESEAAEKIMGLCMGNSGFGSCQNRVHGPGLKGKEMALYGFSGRFQEPGRQVCKERSTHGIGDGYNKKRVGFLPVNEIVEIGLTLESR